MVNNKLELLKLQHINIEFSNRTWFLVEGDGITKHGQMIDFLNSLGLMSPMDADYPNPSGLYDELTIKLSQRLPYPEGFRKIQYGGSAVAVTVFFKDNSSRTFFIGVLNE